MVTLVSKRRWGIGSYQCEYILDTEDDVANLPKCGTGSTALVVATGNVYIVNASGEWKLFGGGA